jgi:hypothetical protein
LLGPAIVGAAFVSDDVRKWLALAHATRIKLGSS